MSLIYTLLTVFFQIDFITKSIFESKILDELLNIEKLPSRNTVKKAKVHINKKNMRVKKVKIEE